MKRVPEVIDCWFDSGAMPFAQHHYPFENKELFESQFPAQFISAAVKNNDMAIITIGKSSGEFLDRKISDSFNLTKEEKDMISPNSFVSLS